MSMTEQLTNGNLKITIPIRISVVGSRRRVKVGDTPVDTSEPLIVHLARAFRWQELIDTGVIASSDELATKLNIDPSHVRRTIRLTALSPEIVHDILAGNTPEGMTLASLRMSIPMVWEDQREFFRSLTK